MNHGTRSGYTHFGCRCELCTEANRKYSREYIRRKARAIREMLEPIAQGPAAHGTWTSYGNGCRCTRCRDAMREQTAKRKRTNRLPIAQPVPLAPLLERIASYVGEPVEQLDRYVIARVCGVSERTVTRWYQTQEVQARMCDDIAIKLGWHPAAIWGVAWYIETYDTGDAA
jgi:hypothetical protein